MSAKFENKSVFVCKVPPGSSSRRLCPRLNGIVQSFRLAALVTELAGLHSGHK